eukprot:CAMPEP_0185038216 /NCGR_PEP_ID=MMETSP1103-20130426/33605_1 /TAXON_ID=36769 /ORGANISM="Paraphysomonas bandaiensis, Strain Caron Lab Isolate" /LENGTH=546 /DNA_ID=CAMNT_0027576547 /DNA_START=583 /DNA_END=2223 /DNA_ORIENTATION=+
MSQPAVNRPAPPQPVRYPQQQQHVDSQMRSAPGQQVARAPPTSTTGTVAASSPSPSQALQPLSAQHISIAVRYIQSNDTDLVNQGLNALMQASMDAESGPLSQARAALHLEKFPSLLTALGSLLDTVNPFTRILFAFDQTAARLDGAKFTLSTEENKSQLYWNEENPLDNDNALQAMARALDSNSVLIAALTILRNMSFEMSNMQQIANSAPIVQHLVALLMVAASPSSTAPPVPNTHVSRLRNSSLTQASSYAVDTLYHIARYIDITGRRRLAITSEDCWLRDTFEYTGTDRDALKVQLSEQMSSVSIARYVSATSRIYPALLRCMSRTFERDIVRRCLGIFTKLSSVPENAVVVCKCCPDKDLAFLVQLLCVSTTTCEAISTQQSGDAHRFSKVPACAGEFSEFCDMEIRDLTLDALRTLCMHTDASLAPQSGSLPVEAVNEVPESLKERIASQPSCLRYLANIITSTKTQKSEGFHRSLALLSLLALDSKNHQKFMSIQTDLHLAALSDDAVSEHIMQPAMRSILQEHMYAIADTAVMDPEIA